MSKDMKLMLSTAWDFSAIGAALAVSERIMTRTILLAHEPVVHDSEVAALLVDLAKQGRKIDGLAKRILWQIEEQED